MSEARVAGPSTMDMSAAPAALESSPPSAKDKKSAKNKFKLMQERTKKGFQLVYRGEAFYRLFDKEESQDQALAQEMMRCTASKDAVQRSKLAHQGTAQREREEVERAQKAAERRASRESNLRERANSSISARFRRHKPRRSSNLVRMAASEAQERRPPTMEQAVRYGQQHGRGVESVAEEFNSRSNSVANMATVHETTAQPQGGAVLQRARSAHQLMPVETAETGGSSITMVPLEVVRAENIRATKSAVDLRDKVVEGRDSGTGSMGTNSMDSIRRMGRALGVRKKVSVSSSRYSQPEAGIVVDAAGRVEDEGMVEGLAMVVAPVA